MSAGSFELRALRPDDEAAFVAAHAAVPPDNPTFLRGYADGLAYREYLRRLDDQRDGRGLAPGAAASTLLFAFVDGAIAGRASVRHALVGAAGEADGHIGYAVLPAFRRQGLGTRLLAGALAHARDTLGLARVLVTCDDDNPASRRVIEKNGGVFESLQHDPAQRRPKRRYWIDTR